MRSHESDDPDVILCTDGGSRGNPGPAAAGAIMRDLHTHETRSFTQFLGKRTNNEAEYEAVVLGLKKIRARYGKKKTKQMRILCTLDSELVVKQLNHEYKIQDAKIQPLFIAVWNLLLDFGSVTFRHVPRSHTTDADRLVNETLDSQARTLF